MLDLFLQIEILFNSFLLKNTLNKINFTQFASLVLFYVLLTFITFFPALDVVLYGAHFAGMKLAGIILISVGFFLVMFPNNWPDYITRLLRYVFQIK